MRFCFLTPFALLFAAIPALNAGMIDAIYSFGDSLTDTGNVFAATGGTHPGVPYVGGRFSNGPVWIDDLASSLGLQSKASLAGGNNFAYGGAESGTTPVHPTLSPADLLGTNGQIAQFKALHPAADPNALYTIWIGSNDLDDLLLSNPSQAAAQVDIGAIVGNIDTSILDLAVLGAHNFLIVTVPDLGKTPAALAAGPAASAGASLLSGALDNTLVFGAGPIPPLASLAAANHLNLKVLDTFSLLDAITANGSSFGFSDTTTPCLTGEVNFAGGTPCSASVAVQNQHLFWDDKHPTAAGHAIIAADALALVTPEPATWATFGGGLSVILVWLGKGRRKRLYHQSVGEFVGGS